MAGHRTTRLYAVHHPWINRRFVPRLRSISIPISIPPLPIEINLPAFYNAIVTRSDGGWFITTIFQRGNTFGGERGWRLWKPSGLGMGSRKNPWKNSWRTMFRDLIFASVYELAWKIILTSSSKKFDSSLSLSLCSLDFYSPRVTNLRKVREEGGGIIVPFVE